jgi:large subunit ribosomal protein L22
MNGLTKRMASLVIPVTKTFQSKWYSSINHGILSRGSMYHLLPRENTISRHFSVSARFRPHTIPVLPENMIIQDPLGRRYLVSDLCKPPRKKVKPSIIRKRIEVLKTYEGSQKNIRHSPWRLQLICRHVSGMTLEEALLQLKFLNKRFAPLVHKVLARTSNLADIRHSIQPSQLEVAECFATKGSHLRRMKIMGRGRSGVLHHKFSHMRVVLREIDFALKIFLADTPRAKERWIERYQKAQQEYTAAKAKREELQTLESAVSLKEKERKEKEAKNKKK